MNHSEHKIEDSKSISVRNMTLFNLGCEMRRKGDLRGQIIVELSRINREECEPPLSEMEVLQIIDRVIAFVDSSLTSEEARNSSLAAKANPQYSLEQLMGADMKRHEPLAPEPVNMPLIDAMYRMADVDRFSGFPMNKKNCLAIHCYNVGNLFLEIARAERIFLTIAEISFVFRHDILETVTGDMLNPAKRWTEAINEHWDAIEEALVNDDEFSWAQPYTDKWAKGHMSSKAHELFLECDRLDLCLMLQREIKKGNVYYMNHHRELGRIDCPIEPWLKTLDKSQFETMRGLADQIRTDLYE